MKFEDRRYQEAVTLLTDEIASHRDPMVVSWLRFYLAYSLAKLDRIDEAIAILSAIARNRALPVAPLAYIAQAKLYMARGDLRSASGPYQALLAAFPGYRLVPTTCVYSGVMPEEVLCRGDPSIAARIESIGTFLTVQANAERTTADRTAPALSKSAAWYELGQAWERTNDVDPCVITEAGLERTKTRRYYEAAVAAAPGSVPAGRAAWKLIDLSRPYEWEGDWKAIVAWLFDKYGGFIAAYPSHELVGEATFNLGVATWAQAGYPELFGYIFTPSGWDDWRLRARQLDPWFITGGFGGGKGELIVQHPEDTPKALQIFQDLLVKHPSTPSAPLARYYSAVILDYCLNDGRRAVVEYEVYLRDYPITDPQLGGYADRARRRIAALR